MLMTIFCWMARLNKWGKIWDPDAKIKCCMLFFNKDVREKQIVFALGYEHLYQGYNCKRLRLNADTFPAKNEIMSVSDIEEGYANHCASAGLTTHLIKGG